MTPWGFMFISDGIFIGTESPLGVGAKNVHFEATGTEVATDVGQGSVGIARGAQRDWVRLCARGIDAFTDI